MLLTDMSNSNLPWYRDRLAPAITSVKIMLKEINSYLWFVLLLNIKTHLMSLSQNWVVKDKHKCRQNTLIVLIVLGTMYQEIRNI